jgi:hypothetical protein
MAPEQLRGRATPASDVYSYGVLLFQLFTGHNPFAGEHLLEVLSNVAFECLPPEPMRAARLPDSLIRLIVSLTAKDPAARPTLDTATACLQAALAGRGVATERASVVEPARVRYARRPSSRVTVAAVVVVGIAAGAAYLWYSRNLEPDGGQEPTQPPAITAAPAPLTAALHSPLLMPKELTLRDVEGTELAVSPDGRRVVFRADLADGTRLLHLSSLDSSGRPTMLPGTDYARYPFWSPDGSAIAFFAKGKLKRINISERTVHEICDCGGRSGPPADNVESEQPRQGTCVAVISPRWSTLSLFD